MELVVIVVAVRVELDLASETCRLARTQMVEKWLNEGANDDDDDGGDRGAGCRFEPEQAQLESGALLGWAPTCVRQFGWPKPRATKAQVESEAA